MDDRTRAGYERFIAGLTPELRRRWYEVAAAVERKFDLSAPADEYHDCADEGCVERWYLGVIGGRLSYCLACPLYWMRDAPDEVKCLHAAYVESAIGRAAAARWARRELLRTIE
jgi:hypothetical protein